MSFHIRWFRVVGVFMLLYCHPAFAGPTARQRLDSLLSVTGIPAFEGMDDKAKADVLWQIGALYGGMHSDSGESYARQALELSEKSGYLFGQGASLAVIGRFYARSGGGTQAEHYYFRSLAVFEKARSDSGVAWACNDIAGVYFNMGRFSKALEYFKRAEQMARKLAGSAAIVQYWSNIAETLGRLGRYDEAMRYQSKVVSYYRAESNHLKIGTSLHNSANFRQASGDLYGALPLFLDALAHYSLGDTSSVYYWENRAALLNDLGLCYLGLATGGSSGAADKIPAVISRSKLDSALYYLFMAHSLISQPDVVDVRILRSISDALAIAGRYRDALLWRRRYDIEKDSVLSNDQLLKMAAGETAREVALREKQEEINRLERRRRREEQWLFVGGISLLAVILMLVMKSYRQQRQANHLNVALLQQKDVLMKEIYHRVKNNLQVISTLLDLQLSSVNDDRAREAMTESASRVRSISLIHQQLYQHEDISSLDFSRFAGELFRQVAAVFRYGEQRVALELNVPPAELDIDTAVPLGLILNELLTNSFKYAFGKGEPGTITIGLTRDEEYYRLSYRDSGPGLPEGMKIMELKSLGMKLLHRLGKQLGGNFSYSANDHIFTVVFKDMEGRKKTD